MDLSPYEPPFSWRGWEREVVEEGEVGKREVGKREVGKREREREP